MRRNRTFSDRVRRALLLGLGWMFVLVGIAGLFLPILQGVLFLVIGLALLAQQSPRARLLLRRLKQRFPKLGRAHDAARAHIRALLRRLRPRREATGRPSSVPVPRGKTSQRTATE